MRNFKLNNRNILACFFALFTLSMTANEVTIVEVKTAAHSFMNSKFLGRTFNSITSLRNSNEQVIGYVATFKPTGYLVLSNNTNLYPIIAYSEDGSFRDEEKSNNVLLDMVKWDLEARNSSSKLKSSNQTISDNNSAWNTFLTGIKIIEKSTQEIYGPILTTNWYQSGFYNDYCPIDSKGNRSVVGCVATATAQIVNYWQFPKQMYFDETDSYISNGRNGSISIPEDAITNDFLNFSELNSELLNIKYDDTEKEIAYLSFGIGVKSKMNFSSNGSGASQNNLSYLNMGFGSANYGRWNSCYEAVINNIQNGWPVQVSIHNYDLGNHHSVVFDGFDTSDNSFHVNMGWSGTSEDTWYIPPALNTNYEFNSMGWAIYNISPNQGWSQYASDEKNSRRTVYSIPETIDYKWFVTGEGDYRFQGLVVGASSKIISTWSPRGLNQGHNSYVYIISEDGVLESKIELFNEDRSISHPAQSRDGKIYVATAKGNVYSIDQKEGIANKIFSDPNGDMFDMGNIKIGNDGNIYASTDYTFYCLNSSGSLIWKTPAPTNCWYPGGTPAIDDSRNKVYNSYYNSVDKKSYFLVIDKISGDILIKKEFTDIPYASRHLGIPSIADNGKVYFGKRTKLFELDVDNNYSFSEIYDNEWSTISQAPAIGKDGTIYCYYWINNSQGAIGAFNPTTKTKKWEIPIDLGDYDGIVEIYVDNNNTICFTIHRENGSDHDTYKLNAYKDNGTSYTKLWENSFDTDIGFTAFGPNNTIYVANNKSIMALSKPIDGESFVGYTNNNPPDKPIYSFPNNGAVDTDTDITFSWSCSDVDGHDLKYIFYFGTAAMLGIYEEGLESNTIEISGLSKDSTYLWSVAATDGQSITEGPIWSFKTKGSGVGIKDLGESLNISIFPNPAKEMLNIDLTYLKSSNISIELINIKGYTIFSETVQSFPNNFIKQIPISDFPEGIYILKIGTNNGIFIKKVLIE